MDILQLIIGALSPTLNFLGAAAATYLYGSGRILTRAMHLDRVSDLVKNYEAQLAEKDRNHAEVVAGLSSQLTDAKAATQLAAAQATEERSRADAATNALAALSQQVARVATITLDPKVLTP